MMDKHPLIRAYTTFVRNRSNDKIGVIGQPDAGKSALINLLCESKAYIYLFKLMQRLILKLMLIMIMAFLLIFQVLERKL